MMNDWNICIFSQSRFQLIAIQLPLSCGLFQRTHTQSRSLFFTSKFYPIAMRTINFCGLLSILVSIDWLIIGCCSFSVEKDVVFRLYTPEFPITFVGLNASNHKSISGAAFNPHRPTVVFIHGWRSALSVMNRYKDAFVLSFDVNFIAVDWLKLANTYNYIGVKRYVRPVSCTHSKFNSMLVENEIVFVFDCQ